MKKFWDAKSSMLAILLVVAMVTNTYPFIAFAENEMALAEEDFIIQDGVLLTYLGSGGEVIIPPGVEAIGSGVFQNNTAVTGVTFNEGLETIGENAFRGCGNMTGTLVLPSALTSIGNYAFYNCSGISGNLEIPANVLTIGNDAFYGDNKIAGLILPDTLASIGNNAFQNCTGMAGNLAIPGSVASIGSGAFYGCTGLNGTLTLTQESRPSGTARLTAATN